MPQRRFLLIALFLLHAVLASAQISFEGKIVTPSGEPIPGATISLHELNKVTATTIEGRFAFQNINKGKYHIHISVAGIH